MGLAPNSFWAALENDHIISPLLAKVDRQIRELLAGVTGPTAEVIDYVVSRSGKRLRPVLVVLSSSLYGVNSAIAVDLAAAIELVHLASLVHDDVIDGASTRRNQPSLNSRFDNHVAVLAGDHLFATAFEVFSRYHEYNVLELITSAIRQMCDAEIAQSIKTFDLGASEQDYWQCIEKKTASLLAASCSLAARIGGVSAAEEQKMGQFGTYLGYAFQITDDIMDIASPQIRTGKSVGQDLWRGIMTLPIIKLLSHDQLGSKARCLIEQWRDTKEKGESHQLFQSILYDLRCMLQDSGILDWCRQQAYLSVQRAKEYLCDLAYDSPAKELMLSLADAIVDRDS
ncbi:MAG: polyprenyl synthetase family protein [Clostridia bacterium]|nr:polyprenyl synthetase family protein [Clostridia bacterium]